MRHTTYRSQQCSRINENPENGQNLFKLTLLVGLAYLIWSEKLSINIGSPRDAAHPKIEYASALPDAPSSPVKKGKQPVGVVINSKSYNNVTFAIDPTFAKRNNIPHTDVETCQQAVRKYLRRFSKVAVAEMEKFGIPASITLAQGLLESNAGMSKLCLSTNNHFGIKCFSKSCRKGHCQNFTDDTHKDFFRKYDNSWQSFRAHSEFLASAARYQHLFSLKRTDFVGWARGLAAAGYATDKKYGEKLIAIIHNLDLERFDKLSSEQLP